MGLDDLRSDERPCALGTRQRSAARPDGLTRVAAVQGRSASFIWRGPFRSGVDWFQWGLCRYAQGGFTWFTEREGLPPGAIMDIYVDRSGRVWLASSRSGLVRVDDAGAKRPAFLAIPPRRACRATMQRSSPKMPTGTSTSAAGAGSTTSIRVPAASSISPPRTDWRRVWLDPFSAIALAWSGSACTAAWRDSRPAREAHGSSRGADSLAAGLGGTRARLGTRRARHGPC